MSRVPARSAPAGRPETEEVSGAAGAVAQQRRRRAHPAAAAPVDPPADHLGLRLCVLVVYPVSSLLFRLGYRHADRIPPTGGVLLVANHVSVLDPLSCARLVWDSGRIPHFLAKESVFTGLAGTILRAAGQIPVSRGTSTAGSSATRPRPRWTPVTWWSSTPRAR